MNAGRLLLHETGPIKNPGLNIQGASPPLNLIRDSNLSETPLGISHGSASSCGDKTTESKATVTGKAVSERAGQSLERAASVLFDTRSLCLGVVDDERLCNPLMVKASAFLLIGGETSVMLSQGTDHDAESPQAFQSGRVCTVNIDMPALCTEEAPEDLNRSPHSGIISVQPSLGRISKEQEVLWISSRLSAANLGQVIDNEGPDQPSWQASRAESVLTRQGSVTPVASRVSDSFGLNAASGSHDLQMRRPATDLLLKHTNVFQTLLLSSYSLTGVICGLGSATGTSGSNDADS